MKLLEIKPLEYGAYYQRYLDKLDAETSLGTGFVQGKEQTIDFFENIKPDKLSFRYEKDKWTTKEIFQHLIDTERIFMYRCFRIARRDLTPLSGFNQNTYVLPSEASRKSIESLLNEYRSVRDCTLNLINSLSEEDLLSMGNADDKRLSARAALFIIIGHEIWHKDIIKERYI